MVDLDNPLIPNPGLGDDNSQFVIYNIDSTHRLILKILLGENQTPIMPNIAPVLNESINEGFDTLSFSYVSNDSSPLEQQQPITYQFAREEFNIQHVPPQWTVKYFDTRYFVITKDKVSVFSKRPLKYLHEVQCSQKIQSTTKKIIRDMVYRQPARQQAEEWATLVYYKNDGGNYLDWYIKNYNDENIPNPEMTWAHIYIKDREKISTLEYRCDCLGFDIGAEKIYYSLPYVKARFRIIVQLLKRGNLVYTEYLGANVYIDQHDDYTEYETLPIDWEEYDFDEIRWRIDNLTQTTTSSANTRVFTCRAFIRAKTYYYTYYDILNDIREISANKYNENANPTYLFNLPPSTASSYAMLQQIAPDIVITQSTVYQALDEVAKALGGYWTLGSSNYLVFNKYNLNNRNIGATLNKIAVETEAQDGNYFNGVQTNYQNARLPKETTLYFPAKYGFQRPCGIGAGSWETKDCVLLLPEPIDYPIKLECLTGLTIDSTTPGGSPLKAILGNIPIDCTNQMVNQEEYGTIGSHTLGEIVSRYDFKPKTQCCIPYNQYSNKIIMGQTENAMILGGLCIAADWNVQYVKNAISNACAKFLGWHDFAFSTTNAIEEYQWRLCYKPVLSGKLRIEGNATKYDGEMYSNLASSQPSLSNLGLNMYGLASKLGQNTQQITKEFDSYENKIQKGDYFIEGGNIWRANEISTTIYKNYVKCSATFTKNFNKLSPRIDIDSKKRTFDISDNLYCEHIVNDYIYLAPHDYFHLDYGQAEETCISWANGTLIHFADNFGFTDGVLTNTFNNASVDFAIITTDATYLDGYNLYIPLTKYGTANTLVFKVGYSHPINAWYHITTKESHYFNEVAKYTDDSGFFNEATINFYHANTGDIATQQEFNLNKQYPYISANYLSVCKTFFNINQLRYMKHQGEIFGLSYQITALVHPEYTTELFLGRKFMEENLFVCDKQQRRRLIYSNEYIYNNFDTKGVGIEVPYDTWTHIQWNIDSSYENAITLQLEWTDSRTGNILPEHKSWAIVDEDGEIIIACNSQSEPLLCYFTRKNRL